MKKVAGARSITVCGFGFIILQSDPEAGFRSSLNLRFLALPFPVALVFIRARWTADRGSPFSSQARMAALSIGKSALTLENCPKNSSSMWTSTATRLTMPATPTVRLTMVPSSRTVWAARPPSVKILATPSDVPGSKPSTYLRAQDRGFAWFTPYR